MISIHNKPLSRQAVDQDFTTAEYRNLIKLALDSYQQADYRSIPWGRRFVLWRHDCDYSLNRSLVLARIDAEEGMRSTFFLNVHSEFYNLLEGDQIAKVKEIVRLGHDIGLHFDAAFYNTSAESELNEQISREAVLLEQFTNVRPVVFSFHNPTEFHLACEADTYGGLINCYSWRLKNKVTYCSDSNGYWRFLSLHDVLTQATAPCLHVLTHPEWWQEKPMPPRQRIFRSAYGRAQASIRSYDEGLKSCGRENLAGAAQSIRFLEAINPEEFELCDYLWNTERFPTLYVELWHLHELQITRLCKAVVSKDWGIPAREVNDFFDNDAVVIDGWRLFNGVFGTTWQAGGGHGEEISYREWKNVRNQLVHGRSSSIGISRLEEGCVYLCTVIQATADFGKATATAYNGLAPFATIGLASSNATDGNWGERLEETEGDIPDYPRMKWVKFKSEILNDVARTREC